MRAVFLLKVINVDTLHCGRTVWIAKFGGRSNILSGMKRHQPIIRLAHHIIHFFVSRLTCLRVSLKGGTRTIAPTILRKAQELDN